MTKHVSGLDHFAKRNNWRRLLDCHSHCLSAAEEDKEEVVTGTGRGVKWAWAETLTPETWNRKVKVRKLLLAHCLLCSKNSLLISSILSLQGVSQTICLMAAEEGAGDGQLSVIRNLETTSSILRPQCFMIIVWWNWGREELPVT